MSVKGGVSKEVDGHTLYSLVNEENDRKAREKILAGLGGPKLLAKTLGVDILRGIRSDEVPERAEKFGKNQFPVTESQTWIELFLESFEDTTVLVLIVSAVVSLAVGLYEDVSKGWIEGSAILMAVLIVAVVTATNNFEKEKQFQKLNAIKENIHATVLRDGATVKVNTKDLVVGDIVELNSGDKVPADGVVLSGNDIGCDESSLNGEPDLIAKGDEDHVLLSGTNLGSGCCSMLVICVGEESRWGKLRATLGSKTEDTPLQEKLDALAGQIGNGGMLAAGLTFFSMLFVFFYYADPAKTHDSSDILEYTLKAFIMAVTIVVVAVPEGLPLAVTLSLAFSTQKMMADNNLIRVLSACETMGNATNICSDKTGTLTQNRMTVVEGWVGNRYYESFPDSKEIPRETAEFIIQNAAINSTANLVHIDKSGQNEPEVLGNKTEGALLLLLHSWNIDYANIRSRGFDAERGDKLFTFSSARKTMSALVGYSFKSGKVLYTKGASEVVLAQCSAVLDGNGNTVKLDSKKKQELDQVIRNMAEKKLRTFAIAHRIYVENDLTVKSIFNDFNSKLGPESLEQDLVLDCIVGIKDPLRPDVADAVRTCQEAGILVRMVTGDNLETARAIATECGILTEGGTCMEGPEFRRLSPEARENAMKTLQVLARSTPNDKLVLVQSLNGSYMSDEDRAAWTATRDGECAEVVGVTGDGTNDAPALKAADVGLSMGLCGTEVAKEASDIVILDDNFSSIVKAVMWGRSVFDNIRKFLQFQLTVNVVALTITFVSAITGFQPPLNAVMMLWVNLIMDTMGALALGTESPSPELLARRPYKRDASLINNKMWRNIFVQSIFQICLLAYLLVSGAEDFDVEKGARVHMTVVFTTFVFCQIFNEFNARSIGDDCDIFRGLFQNPIFLFIIVFTCGAQYCLVQYGGDFVRTSPLDNHQWSKCIKLASLTFPIGGIMRIIPVADSENDFAPVSALISRVRDSRKGKLESSSKYSLTLIVWFVLIGAVCSIVYNEFGAIWTVRFRMLLVWLQYRH